MEGAAGGAVKGRRVGGVGGVARHSGGSPGGGVVVMRTCGLQHFALKQVRHPNAVN